MHDPCSENVVYASYLQALLFTEKTNQDTFEISENTI